MKVWERIAQFEDAQGMDKKQIAKLMYDYKMTPCDAEDEHGFLSEDTMNKLCKKYQLECRDCLDEYLESEVDKDEFLQEHNPHSAERA